MIWESSTIAYSSAKIARQSALIYEVAVQGSESFIVYKSEMT